MIGVPDSPAPAPASADQPGAGADAEPSALRETIVQAAVDALPGCARTRERLEWQLAAAEAAASRWPFAPRGARGGAADVRRWTC